MTRFYAYLLLFLTSATVAIANEPITANDIINLKWESTYTNLLVGQTGSIAGKASFSRIEGTDTLALTMPGLDDYELKVGFEDSNLIIYGRVNDMIDGDKAVLCPLHVTDGPILDSENILIPFNPETNAFEFPTAFRWGLCAFDPETDEFVGYYWAVVNITLSVTDGDYSLNATLLNELSDDNLFTFRISPGDDVAKVRMIITDSAEMAEEQLWTFYTGYAITLDVTGGESTEVTVDPVHNHWDVGLYGPIDSNCLPTILLASFDTDDNARKFDQFQTIVLIDDADGWRNVGNVAYNDLFYQAHFPGFTHTQQAMLQQNENNPSMLRLMNPYSELSASATDGTRNYITFDISNPESVKIPTCCTGMSYGRLQNMCVASMHLFPTATSAQPITLTDRTITVSPLSFGYHIPQSHNPKSWYQATNVEQRTLTLPEVKFNLEIVYADNKPAAGATFTTDDATLTADADGRVSYTAPFKNGYFAPLTFSVNGEAPVTIDLNGAETGMVYTLGIGITDFDSISEITAGADADAWFDLHGRRIARPTTPGLYIHNRTKVLIR